MTGWARFSSELERLLRLTSRPIAYKKFEKAAELEKIPKLRNDSLKITRVTTLSSKCVNKGYTRKDIPVIAV